MNVTLFNLSNPKISDLAMALLNLGIELEVIETSPNNWEIYEIWSPSGSDWDNEYIPVVKGDTNKVVSVLETILKREVERKN